MHVVPVSLDVLACVPVIFALSGRISVCQFSLPPRRPNDALIGGGQLSIGGAVTFQLQRHTPSCRQQGGWPAGETGRQRGGTLRLRLPLSLEWRSQTVGAASRIIRGVHAPTQNIAVSRAGRRDLLTYIQRPGLWSRSFNSCTHFLPQSLTFSLHTSLSRYRLARQQALYTYTRRRDSSRVSRSPDAVASRRPSSWKTSPRSGLGNSAGALAPIMSRLRNEPGSSFERGDTLATRTTDGCREGSGPRESVPRRPTSQLAVYICPRWRPCTALGP